jgi:hypothetical protein
MTSAAALLVCATLWMSSPGCVPGENQPSATRADMTRLVDHVGQILKDGVTTVSVIARAGITVGCALVRRYETPPRAARLKIAGDRRGQCACCTV